MKSSVAVKQYTDFSEVIDLSAEYRGADRGDIVPVAFYVRTADGDPGTLGVVPRSLLSGQTEDGYVILSVDDRENRELQITRITTASNIGMVEVHWGNA